MFKNYNRFSHPIPIYGVFRVKKPYFGRFAPYIDEYFTLRAQYYIRPHKNDLRVNTVNCIADISHFWSWIWPISQIMVLEDEKYREITKDKVSETLKS